MNLSDELISQFAKLTAGEKETNKENTVYGTVVEFNGTKYVKLDGSDQLTPVTSTTRINNEDRVTVMIKNHTATVTGNISSPSATGAEVDTLGENIKVFDTVLADKVSTDELAANNAEIANLYAKKAEINDLVANTAVIGDLKAVNLGVEGKFKAVDAEIEDLTARNVTITDKVSANEASILKLEAKDADIERLYAKTADIEDLYATKANVNELVATKANVTDLNATNAKVGTLTADVGDINTLIFGSASGETIQTEFANAVIAQLGDAQIKSAMIKDVSASKITAGDIITNNVVVKSEDGKLLISDETIQISDDTRVRVQIGKDAAGDYSINIWDTDGKLMFSEGGITDSAIKDAIIRNDMVSENANISASKLDIESLFTEINGSTETIKSSRIYLNDEEQTLDLAFKTMSTDVSGVKSTVESQGTQISTIQGQISSKIWQQDIEAIEIGGRNLLLDTKRERTLVRANSNVTIDYDHVSDLLSLGDSSFVISYDAKADVDGMSVDFYFRSSDGIAITKEYSHPITTEYVRYEENVEFKNTNYICANINNCRFRANAGSGTVTVKNIKLEKGTKATDWTPAPEDTESSISTLTTQYSTLNQTVFGIETAVGEHTTAISSKADKKAVTEVSDKLSTLEQDVDGFKTTVSSTYVTKTDLSNLEIGGRNLLLDTKKERTLVRANSNVTTDYAYVSDLLSLYDSSFVISYDAKADTAGMSVDFYFRSVGTDTTATSITKAYSHTISTEYKRYEALVEFGSGYSCADITNCRFRVNAGSGTVSVKNIKLERGAKATDWTPAPEDMESSISTLSTKYSELEQDVDGFKTTVSSTYVTKTDLSNLEIGGRNLLPNTETMDSYATHSSAILSKNAEGFMTASFPAATTLEWRGVHTRPPIRFSTIRGRTVTLSLYAKTSDPGAYNADSSNGLVVAFALCSSDSTTRELYRSIELTSVELSTEWKKISTTITLDDEAFTSGSGTITDTTRMFVSVYNHSIYPIDVKQFKMEFGNKATDWSPATEDINNKFTDYPTTSQTQSMIDQKADSITSSVSATYATKTALDNLKVGGRNLVLNSGEEVSFKNALKTFNLSEYGTEKAKNRKITMSFDAYTDEPGVGIDFYVRYITDGSGKAVGTTPINGLTDSYVRYSATVNVYDNDLTMFAIRSTTSCTAENPSTTATIYVKNVKVELGTMATDWTPAPEDMASTTDLTIYATKTEVTQTENSIKSSVKASIEDLEIGGRNLLPNTKTMDGYDNHASITYSEDGEKTTIASFPAADALAWQGVFVYPPIPFSTVRDRTVTLSLLAKTTDPDAYNADTTHGLSMVFALCGADSTTRQKYRSNTKYKTELTDEWQKISVTATLADSYFTSGTGTIDDDTRMYIVIYNYSVYPMDVKQFKLEFGDKATDWTPSPEDVTADIADTQKQVGDVETRLSSAETTIQQLVDNIQMLVTNSQGTSLMTQTSTGWTFSTDQIQSTISDTSKNLSDLIDKFDGVSDTVSNLSNAVDDFGVLTEYVKIGTYEGEPCIELGESDSDFKLLITNTRIMFKEGSGTPAYITNQSMHIKKAVVEEELQQGSYVWKIRSNGNMGLQWIGGDE